MGIMGIMGVSHIGIGVRDMEASIRFYRDVLGMKLTHEKDYLENPDMLQIPAERERRTAYLTWDEASNVALVLSRQPSEPTNSAIKLDDVGIHHLAFWVDDIDAMCRRLKEAGVKIIFEPKYGGQARGPVSTMFLEDPDGILLQLDERPRPAVK